MIFFPSFPLAKRGNHFHLTQRHIALHFTTVLLSFLQATAITNLVHCLTLTAEQEERRVKEAFIVEEEQTAAESLRLSCEVERISVEEAYTCEEEKTLSEQAGEMESAIAVQAGSAMDKKASIEAQKGVKTVLFLAGHHALHS